MSDLEVGNSRGVLRRGWSAAVDDYPIAGGWSRGGEALMVGDAEGSVYALDGKSGSTAWSSAGFTKLVCSPWRSTRTEPSSPRPARMGES